MSERGTQAGTAERAGAPERRTQADRTAQARRRLLRATIRLLAERGYTGTTLGEIGREAGLSRGLVTHHFGTKDACIGAAIEEIRSSAGRTILSGGDGRRGLAGIDHLITAYIGSMRDGDEYMRAMYVVMADAISSAPVLREAVAGSNEAFRALIRTWLGQAAEDGEIPEAADLDAHAVLIEGLLRGICLQWLIDPGRVDLDASIRTARRAVRAGLGAR
ncbi:TetR/AcrR family transcriptional regulator [Planomonospora venezuelensis]|uniref:AcrR family transcriptional regulator n=1 Tax=Planomonospora venezuelensis TaxID=1999 RepID=A0A841DEB5_PLAVE|nr:TetR family transcriptional regulator [Planomonospora venezuelensis]MBB5967113.1 AcrR family transcriptional regulator [Planomonospora venezuelensis]GIN04844.1 TetR family transcriptional regulator [Planomonospora venezuelensis]